MEQPNVLPGNQAAPTILEAIQPFEPDDKLKGTFLVLRIAGADRKTALKLVERKYRSWQHWRSTDEDFYRIDEQVPVLAVQFGGEARIIRTALLDSSIIEAAILIFGRFFTKQPVSSDMWAYVTKLAGIRLPMMGAKEEVGSPWERLANSIKTTLAQRELTLKEVNMDGVEQSITAKETIIQPSPEQRKLASSIVGQVLDKTDGED